LSHSRCFNQAWKHNLTSVLKEAIMERRSVLSVGALAAAGGLLSLAGMDKAQAKPKKGGLLLEGATGTFRSASGSGNVVADVLIQSLKVDPQTRGLSVTGVITLVSGVTGAAPQRFAAPAILTAPAAGDAVTAQAVCSILNLDIGAIHLDLLGLVIDLSPISLDITAVPGGGLLGDLLCGLANLLNGGGLFQTIQRLVNQINQILRGLGC
jgi:hypothetical protein